jgi:hypothetical protein
LSFTAFSNVLNTAVEIQAFKYMQEIAKQMTEEAREILDSQRYNWEPLSQPYFESKLREGLDTRILIATGFYRDHIAWGMIGDKIWWGVEDVVHEPSGLPLRKLARIHEFGTAIIPARPLWRPLLSKYLRKSPQFANRYRVEVNRAALAARSHLPKAKKVVISL